MVPEGATLRFIRERLGFGSPAACSVAVIFLGARPAPGHVLYMGRFTSIERAEDAEPRVLARVRERYPLYLTAPDKWVEPSLSSLENYARTQQPAPVR